MAGKRAFREKIRSAKVGLEFFVKRDWDSLSEECGPGSIGMKG